MHRTENHRWSVPIVWALLVAASLFGYLLAEGLASARVATTIAILLAATKVHVVFGQYMDLTWQHRPLRLLLAIWLAIVTTILLASYWLT